MTASVVSAAVRDLLQRALPGLFLAVLAASRWPGLMPQNFSAVYALLFCAGAWFPRRLAWWAPLATLLATDLALNVFHYHTAPLAGWMLVNYAAYAGLIALGRWIGRGAPLAGQVGGSLLGAILFYLVTNTASWIELPAYTKDLRGWIQALTLGSEGWPATWTFFRNTLTSTGLFTTLFGAAHLLTRPTESPRDKGEEEAPKDGEEAAEEAPAA